MDIPSGKPRKPNRRKRTQRDKLMAKSLMTQDALSDTQYKGLTLPFAIRTWFDMDSTDGETLQSQPRADIESEEAPLGFQYIGLPKKDTRIMVYVREDNVQISGPTQEDVDVENAADFPDLAADTTVRTQYEARPKSITRMRPDATRPKKPEQPRRTNPIVKPPPASERATQELKESKSVDENNYITGPTVTEGVSVYRAAEEPTTYVFESQEDHFHNPEINTVVEDTGNSGVDFENKDVDSYIPFEDRFPDTSETTDFSFGDDFNNNASNNVESAGIEDYAGISENNFDISAFGAGDDTTMNDDFYSGNVDDANPFDFVRD